MKFLGGDIVRTSDSASAFSGDVAGPAFSQTNHLPRFDGTTGKLLKAGQIIEDDSGNVGIGGDPLSGATGTLKVGAGYTLTNHLNTTLTANSISTTLGGWVASAYSNESFAGDVSAFARVESVGGGYAVLGLNSDPATDTSFTSLDYGCYFHVNEMYVVIGGVATAATPQLLASLGDTIGIRRAGTSIEFLHNGTVFQTVTGVSASTPLYLDTALDIGGGSSVSLTNITFGPIDVVKTRAEGTALARVYKTLGGNSLLEGTTLVTVKGGVPVFAGADGRSIKQSPVTHTDEGDIRSGNVDGHYGVFNSIIMGGMLQGRNGRFLALKSDGSLGALLQYYPDWGGHMELAAPVAGSGGVSDEESYYRKWAAADCIAYTSFGDMVFNPNSVGETVERFRMTHDSRFVVHALTLSLIDAGGCTVTANSITRTSGSGAWDAAGLSGEHYFGDVAVFTTLSGTAATAAIGLTFSPWTDNSFTSINYCIKLDAGVLYVTENGTAIYTGPGFVIGDVIGVSRVGTTVEYSKNGAVFHTTTGVSATIPLSLDTSFYASGMIFSAISFAPPVRARISAAGLIESTSGGFKFPDGTTQATAAAGAGGVTTVDFGAFPGTSDASVTITGQSGIVAGSRVKAWIQATATADHSADEHWLESLSVTAGGIAAGTGFTIYAKNTGTLGEPVAEQWAGTRLAGLGTGINQIRPDIGGGKGTRLYGQFTVAWEWI